MHFLPPGTGVQIGILLRSTLWSSLHIGIHICLVFSIATSTYAASPKMVTSAEYSTGTTSIQKKAGLPQRIVIPRIALDAWVEILWLTKDGYMEVPLKYASTGWLRTGSKPGNPGTSVIAGHYGWIGGKPTVFTKLDQLKKGDGITVYDRKWSRVDFEVVYTKIYHADDGAHELFATSEWTTRLNLVTCQGVWNPRTKSYPNRLVIFAIRKNSTPLLKFP